MALIEDSLDEKLQRTIMTPEGVPLHVWLDARGERAAAFMLDIIIQFTAIFLVSLGFLFALTPTIGIQWTIAILTFVFFVLRTAYFSFFELHWQGRTPGKRAIGLRVIDRHGAALSPVSVLTRNFMREIEIFLPLTILSMSAANTGESIAVILLGIWVCIFAFLPLFNRDALRVGDLVAGTWVIRNPKVIMLSDLAATGGEEDRPTDPYTFTAAQLGIYGIKELQVLEDVLRHRTEHAGEMRAEVAKRIQQKIAWDPKQVPGYSDEAFLRAFYRALRKELEGSMLMGRRKESKTDT